MTLRMTNERSTQDGKQLLSIPANSSWTPERMCWRNAPMMESVDRIHQAGAREGGIINGGCSSSLSSSLSLYVVGCNKSE